VAQLINPEPFKTREVAEREPQIVIPGLGKTSLATSSKENPLLNSEYLFEFKVSCHKKTEKSANANVFLNLSMLDERVNAAEGGGNSVS